MQPSPYADQPQYGALFPAKDKAAQRNPELPLLPHLPAFTVLPASADIINLRALAQSSRYLAAQSKVQETKDIARDRTQRIGGVNNTPAQDGLESRIIAEEQDLDAAGILTKAANEQHSISIATYTESRSIDTGNETETISVMEMDMSYCDYEHYGFPPPVNMGCRNQVQLPKSLHPFQGLEETRLHEF